jgi:hypothetical protein
MAPTAARKATTNKAAASKAEPAEPAPKAETESQKRNRLRNEAERIVINNHKDEFVQVATALFAENGLVFHRRLTEKEKAAKEIADKLNQFPELRGMFAAMGAAHAEAVQEALAGGDPGWEAQQQRVREVAAADGVEFHQGE